MKNILLFFCFVTSLSVCISCDKKSENSFVYHENKPVLKNTYAADKKKHAKGKYRLTENMSVADTQTNELSEWISNVGEAMDMMK